MPKPLKRPREVGAYWWSYLRVKDLRTLSEEFNKNYDLIEWEKNDKAPDEIVDSIRGRAKRWIYK